MKYLLLLSFSIIQLSASSQSPYLSILVKMDSIKAAYTRYKIEMKICEIKNAERGAWFNYDSSKIKRLPVGSLYLKR